jgi:hypothetical protein
MADEKDTSFESWCIVELFGHQQIAGLVSEQQIAGQGFVRVDVPATEGREGFTRLFGGGAIYSIIPTTEPIATRYATRLDSRPIAPYMLAPMASEVRFGDPDDEDDDPHSFGDDDED